MTSDYLRDLLVAQKEARRSQALLNYVIWQKKANRAKFKENLKNQKYERKLQIQEEQRYKQANDVYI